MAMTKELLANAQTTGAGPIVDNIKGTKTFQAWGSTTAGTGAVAVEVQGSTNGGESWDRLGTISLTLGTATTSDGFTSDDRYVDYRANVTAISGTGAKVYLNASYC